MVRTRGSIPRALGFGSVLVFVATVSSPARAEGSSASASADGAAQSTPPASSPAAPPPPPPPMGVWTGKGQLGYVASQGNSPAKSANAVLDMSYLENLWKHTFHFDFLYGESANVVSAERWDVAWQTNYNFTPDFFVFGNPRYGHDLFDGFQYQASFAAGVGYNVIKTAATTLSVQAGAGYLWQRPEVIATDADGAVTSRMLLPTDDTAIATFGLNYSQKVTSTTTLTDALLVNAGSGNSLITNAFAVAVKISTKLSLNVGYNIQDNTQPPPGRKSLDQFETVNLAYQF
jgi:putative salt-induced outer membrane protein